MKSREKILAHHQHLAEVLANLTKRRPLERNMAKIARVSKEIGSKLGNSYFTPDSLKGKLLKKDLEQATCEVGLGCLNPAIARFGGYASAYSFCCAKCIKSVIRAGIKVELLITQ